MRKLLFAVILLIVFSFAGFSQSKKSKKKDKYDSFWVDEAKKETYTKYFSEGKLLFSQQNYYEAIEVFKKCLESFPNDQQTVAKLRDIEIILASVTQELDKDDSTQLVTRIFVPIEKLELNNETSIEPVQVNRTIANQGFEPDTIVKKQPSEIINEESVVEVKKIEQTLVNVIATKNPSSTVEKNSEEFRTELANQYEDGLTEEKYRKGSREITKRILVTNGLGDEYLKVKHDWGGLFYFKNGAPISMFTWDKETSIQKK